MRPALTSASPARPALLTPALLHLHAFVAGRGVTTSADLIAAGWPRSTATQHLHALWRAGVLIRGRVGLVTARGGMSPYGYVISGRPVAAEREPDTLRTRAAAVLRERGPLTSRQLAAALGTTPKTIATIGALHGWPVVREPVRGHPPVRLRWSA